MTESRLKEGDIVRPGKLYGRPGSAVDCSSILAPDQQREPKTWITRDHVLVYWFQGPGPIATAINDTICCRSSYLRLYEVGL